MSFVMQYVPKTNHPMKRRENIANPATKDHPAITIPTDITATNGKKDLRTAVGLTHRPLHKIKPATFRTFHVVDPL